MKGDLIATPTDNTISNPASIEFLITEYKRLESLINTSFDSYQKRFDVYLAILSASFAGIIAFSEFGTSSIQDFVVQFILIALLILGMITYFSLSYLNVSLAHYTKAAQLIQKSFINRDSKIDDYLYFRHNSIGIVGINFRTLLVRGITGGGYKALLVLVNSLIIAEVLIRFLIWQQIIPFNYWIMISLAVPAFFLSVTLHIMYATWLYRISGIRTLKRLE